MSEIGEALGTAVEGGLFARAVGSGKGTARQGGQPLDHGHFAERSCLNCGTGLVGSHCHNCGQQAHLHRTIGAFLHDLLHGALHFDGKTWRTLPMLAFRPGELTRRYIEGERARFVSPMALFLFSIFLMFAVFQLAGISTPTDIRTDPAGQIRMLAKEEVRRLEEQRAETAQQLDNPELAASQRAELEARLREMDENLQGIRVAEDQVPFLKDITSEADRADPVAGDNEASAARPEEPAGIALDEDGSARVSVKSTGYDWIDSAVAKWRTNPGLMLYKLQTNFYKFSWLLIPLSIPFVWLLFAWKRRFKAYDHAIFVTYSLSFMTLLTLTVTLLGMAGVHEAVIVAASLLIPPIHIYKQMRSAYELGRFSAIWRLAVLTMFILIVLTLFLPLLLLLGAF